MNKLFDVLCLNHDYMVTGRKERVRILNSIYYLCRLSEKAINLFQEGYFSRFDAQVGETSCQIRGYKIASLANQLTNNIFKENIKKTATLLKKK